MGTAVVRAASRMDAWRAAQPPRCCGQRARAAYRWAPSSKRCAPRLDDSSLRSQRWGRGVRCCHTHTHTLAGDQVKRLPCTSAASKGDAPRLSCSTHMCARERIRVAVSCLNCVGYCNARGGLLPGARCTDFPVHVHIAHPGKQSCLRNCALFPAAGACSSAPACGSALPCSDCWHRLLAATAGSAFNMQEPRESSAGTTASG